MRKPTLVLVGLCSLLFATVASPDLSSRDVAVPATGVSSDFDKLVDRYFDAEFKFHPSDGTAAGFHQYDNRLEEFSESAVNSEVASLRDRKARLEAFPADGLPEEAAADRTLLLNAAAARLLELENVQMWRKDPDFYTSSVSESIFLLIRRNFAPQPERLRSVVAREREIPVALDAARKNLTNPPRVFTEVALEDLPDTVEFFRKDVPAAFPDVKDAALLSDFNSANRAAVNALREYEAYLKKHLLPASHGDFRLGAENFSKKLHYEEMVDTPLDRLLEVGFADLHHNQDWLKKVAAQIDPGRSPREVLADLQKDHPAPDQLLQAFRDVLGGLRQFIEQKQIITIPSEIPPIVEETPPFERALTTASMDTPGAYENRATEAMFNVTTPNSSWSRQKIEQWMGSFNRGTIISTAIHEVYPGHYVQFLWLKQAPSKTRKLLFCNSNAEGWAHYTEQMMLDEGYGNGDPKLRLGQLQDALLRDARFVVGIEMHTGKMTLDQATKFFIEEGFQPPPTAEVEAKRGTSDPTYLYYTLGKLQILKLRGDYRQQMNARFNLRDFHDEFMRQGSVPMKVIRKAMLGREGSEL